MEQSTDPRQGWEIVWHIWLQNAVTYSRMKEVVCRALHINKVESVERAIGRANAVVATHGAPGLNALSAAENSLEALRATGYAGLVRIAGITRTN